jgi:DNA polymerase-3 subunit delta
MSLSKLTASLDDALLPVYVVVGDAGPLVDQAVEQIVAAVMPELGPPAFNRTTVRAGEADAAEAFRTARTLPMMGSKRLVEVRELEAGGAAFFEAAVAYCQAPVAEAVVVLRGEKFPKVEKGGSNWGARIKNAVKKSGLYVGLSAKDVSAPQFAQQRARARGKELSTADARLLVEVVGEELSRIDNEVDKLSLYVGEAPAITADAIHEATALLAEAVIWDLTSALASRDPEAALEALHRLQEGGDDPRRLLSMIAWQCRDLLKISARVKAGVSDRQIRNDVRMRYDVMKRVLPRMRDHGFPHEGELMGRLAEANRQMNGHRAGAGKVLEELVLDLVR